MNLLAFLLQTPFVLMSGIVWNCVQGDPESLESGCWDSGVSERALKIPEEVMSNSMKKK